MLERYEGKLSRTVLRRGGASNRLILSRPAKEFHFSGFAISAIQALFSIDSLRFP
jgi:hypothetical protein